MPRAGIPGREDGFRGSKRGSRRDGKLLAVEVGATLGSLYGAHSQPAVQPPVAQQPRVPPGGGTSRQFRGAGS